MYLGKPKSFLPTTAPSFSTFAPRSRLATLAGRSHTSQWVYVPPGASGSSTMMAIAPVPPGTPRHPNLGETSSPKPVYSRGMALPSANASVVTTIVLGAFSALALIWFGTFAMLASHPAAVLQLSARSRFPRPAKLEDVPPDAPVSLDDSSLATLVDRLSHARVVLLGEASHGTHEHYAWRPRITLELLTPHAFSFVAVEGDWP